MNNNNKEQFLLTTICYLQGYLQGLSHDEKFKSVLQAPLELISKVERQYKNWEGKKENELS